MQKRWQHWGAVAPVTLAMAILAGCQTASTTNAPVPNQNFTPGGKATVLPNGSAASSGAASSGAASTPLTSPAQLQALKASALASASGMAITAANGGKYVSADGSLTATIPPGALTQDATIKIAPIDASRLAAGDFVPAIAFAADLGGASLNPGTTISVTMRVAPNFLSQAKANDPNWTAVSYAMSQDASGQWVMTMPIKGPAAAMPANTTPPAKAPTLATSPWLTEFGQLGLPGSAAAATTTSYRLLNTAGCTIPLWLDGYGESAGLWGCGQVPHEDICWSSITPPLVTLATHTTWQSDDSTLNGQPAQGANVRFNYQFSNWIMSNWYQMSNNTGPNDEPVPASGSNSTYAYESTTVQATPYSLLVGASGAPQTVLFQAPSLNNPTAVMPTSYTANLSIPNFNPNITFSISNSEVPLNSTATIAYTLDGVAKTLTADTSALSGKTSGTFSFYVPLPTDASTRYQTHTLAITSVSPAGDVGQVSTLNITPASMSVRVNGRYSASGNIISTGAK